MKTFRLKRSVWVPQPIEEVFPFIADPTNIARITPKWVHYQSVQGTPSEIKVGTRLEHRLKVKGIPIRWVGEITEWDPPYGFVDEQRKGPYRFWRHEHLLHEQRGGTVLEDVITYAVPGGAIIHRLLVEKDLKRIFDYRQDVLRRIFAQSAP